MITGKTPDSWHDLQKATAQILEECGFTTEIEKTTETVRGQVELDIYAEESVNGRSYSIAVECKHWKKRVPQTVIHAFRTVVSDIGVNKGYIVSMEGFQFGAFSASELTNIEIVTWEEFQSEFLESWYDNHFTKRIAELSPLMSYSEPFLPPWFEKMSEPDKERYLNLKKENDIFGMFAQSLGPWGRMHRKEEIRQLPLMQFARTEVIEAQSIPEAVLNATHYRELLEGILAHGNAVLQLYRELKDQYSIEEST